MQSLQTKQKADISRRNLNYNKLVDNVIKRILLLFAAISVITTIAIVFSLLGETVSFFKEVSIVEFFTDTRWTPLLEPKHFGILPLICGTLLITAGASLISIPIGLASAVFLSEYAGNRTRKILKPVLEILAGIPTIVYGYFALVTITPILQRLIPQTNIFNAASASIAVGIMTIPMVASLSEDAMKAVPNALRHGAFAIGSTKFEVVTKIVIPSALSSILASFILAISRAIGETMIVALAAGSTPKLTLNPLESIQTITGYIVQVSMGDTPRGSIESRTIFAAGMVLFMMTLLMNIISMLIVKKFRRVYD